MGANEKYDAAMHGGEYVPSTENVREEYRNGRQFGELYSKTDFRAEFDRWLDRVRAEAKREALNEAVSDFESNVGVGEFEEQSRDGETFWRHVAEAWEAQGPYMQWLRNRANQMKDGN